MSIDHDNHRHAGVATEASLISVLFLLEGALYGAGWIIAGIAAHHPGPRPVAALALVVAAAVLLPWVWVWFYTRVEVITVGPAE